MTTGRPAAHSSRREERKPDDVAHCLRPNVPVFRAVAAITTWPPCPGYAVPAARRYGTTRGHGPDDNGRAEEWYPLFGLNRMAGAAKAYEPAEASIRFS